MKFMSSIVALLLLSSTASYADTPAILGSVSQGSAQVMAKDDAGKLRGGYWFCNKTTNKCGEVGFSAKQREYNTNLASLKYLRTQTSWWTGKTTYVAR